MLVLFVNDPDIINVSICIDHFSFLGLVWDWKALPIANFVGDGFALLSSVSDIEPRRHPGGGASVNSVFRVNQLTGLFPCLSPAASIPGACHLHHDRLAVGRS